MRILGGCEDSRRMVLGFLMSGVGVSGKCHMAWDCGGDGCCVMVESGEV